MLLQQARKQINLANIILIFSAILLGWLLWYFYTGYGGPQELVSRLLSVAMKTGMYTGAPPCARTSDVLSRGIQPSKRGIVPVTVRGSALKAACTRVPRIAIYHPCNPRLNNHG